MSYLILKCPACGGKYSGPITSRFVVCDYCDTRFALTKDDLKAAGFRDEDGDGIDDRELFDENAAFTFDEGAFLEYAEKACKRLLEDLGSDAKEFKSTRKIVNGLGLRESDDILLIHDDTLFKTGKDGFALTRDGIYCREMGDDAAHFVTWDKFAHGKRPAEDRSYVRQGAMSISYFTGNDGVKEELLAFFDKLWRYARR